MALPKVRVEPTAAGASVEVDLLALAASEHASHVRLGLDRDRLDVLAQACCELHDRALDLDGVPEGAVDRGVAFPVEAERGAMLVPAAGGEAGGVPCDVVG